MLKFELFNLTETFAHPKMLIFATSKENVQTNTFDKCTNPRVPHKTLAPQDVAQDSRPPSDRGTEPWANLKCKVRRSSISHEAPYTPRPEPLGQWFLKQTHLFYLKMFAKSLYSPWKKALDFTCHTWYNRFFSKATTWSQHLELQLPFQAKPDHYLRSQINWQAQWCGQDKLHQLHDTIESYWAESSNHARWGSLLFSCIL